MTAVTRTDKLEGARALIDGGVELAIAADASLDSSDRRLSAFFGVVFLVMGIGQGRGLRALTWGGAGATAIWATGQAIEARRLGRTEPARPVTAEPASLEERRATLLAERDALRARLRTENAAPLTRRDRLKSERLVASGVISLVIAADRSLEPHRRWTSAAGGVLAIAGGVGRLRRSERTHPIVVGGYGVLFAARLTAAIVRRLPRR